MATEMTELEIFAILATFTDRDEAGRHFTERYDDDTLDCLESMGLIAIERPVHQPTGIDYDRQYWSAEVTSEGQEWFDVRRDSYVQAASGEWVDG